MIIVPWPITEINFWVAQAEALMVRWPELTGRLCPSCGAKALVGHGQRRRSVHVGKASGKRGSACDVVWFWVQRVRCTGCGKTHTLRPAFVAPYQRHVSRLWGEASAAPCSLWRCSADSCNRPDRRIAPYTPAPVREIALAESPVSYTPLRASGPGPLPFPYRSPPPPRRRVPSQPCWTPHGPAEAAPTSRATPPIPWLPLVPRPEPHARRRRASRPRPHCACLISADAPSSAGRHCPCPSTPSAPAHQPLRLGLSYANSLITASSNSAVSNKMSRASMEPADREILPMAIS